MEGVMKVFKSLTAVFLLEFVFLPQIQAEEFGSAQSSSISLDMKWVRVASLDDIVDIEVDPLFSGIRGDKTVKVLLNGEVILETDTAGRKQIQLDTLGITTIAQQYLVDGVVKECDSVNYVVLNNGLVEIPADWSEIPDDAFRDCEELTEVSIPRNIINISPTAFTGCSNIAFVAIDVGWAEKIAVEVSGAWIEEGAGVYRSCPVGDGQSTEMRAEIDIAGDERYDFQWKVSSEANWDFLSCSVDGAGIEQRISGELGWQDVS